jgi:imidazole glycerol-phosphate synthase subunit HisF
MDNIPNRIIPRIDIKDLNLVKGIRLEGLRVLGNPNNFAKHYYNNFADEIYFQDVVASLLGRNSLYDFIDDITKEIFIPITVGGGIRTIEDISKMLSVGADKISINTQALKTPDFINKSANLYGSSTIVVSVEAIENQNGKFFCFVDNGREETGIELIDWIENIQERGAGEIFLCSVDNEGSLKGYNLKLIQYLKDIDIKIPLIIHGGFSDPRDILKVQLVNSQINAFSISSYLHYKTSTIINKNVANFADGNTHFLNSNSGSKFDTSIDLLEIKKFLSTKNILVRI